MNKNKQKQFDVRLFVAGNAPNSRLARNNLEELCNSLPDCEFQIKIIDVLKDPEQALEEGIYITPALQIVEADSKNIIFGNLSDIEKLKMLFP